jgi:hypothetical protein
MWMGVTSRLAGIKFSGSMKLYPNMQENKISPSNTIKKSRASFTV